MNVFYNISDLRSTMLSGTKKLSCKLVEEKIEKKIFNKASNKDFE